MASDCGPTRLNMPKLKAPFMAEDIILWLGDCDDAIEAFEDLKRWEETLSVVRQIREARMKMQGEGKIWWNQNKEELKALKTWSLFAAEVRARFLDSGFVLTAEHEFYRTAQGSEPFSAYTAKLASRRATLGIGKDGGKIIVDDQFKRHLLHHANDVLYACTTLTAGFSLSTFLVNDLIGHMAAVASSLGHEWLSQASVANSCNSGSNFRADPELNMARRTLLTADTRQECINEGRCSNCREMGHSIRDCPKKKPSTTIGDHLKEQLNYLGHAYSQASDSESDSKLDAAFEAEWYGEEDDKEKGEKKKGRTRVWFRWWRV